MKVLCNIKISFNAASSRVNFDELERKVRVGQMDFFDLKRARQVIMQIM